LLEIQCNLHNTEQGKLAAKSIPAMYLMHAAQAPALPPGNATPPLSGDAVAILCGTVIVIVFSI
jgi:hypothetical protein